MTPVLRRQLFRILTCVYGNKAKGYQTSAALNLGCGKIAVTKLNSPNRRHVRLVLRYRDGQRCTGKNITLRVARF
jgi:hypothetical protein